MTAVQLRTAREVIYQGDDLAHLEHLDKRLQSLADDARAATGELARVDRLAKSGTQPPRLMHEDDPVATARAAQRAAQDAHTAAAAERDTFAAEAETRGVVVVMRAQRRKEWRALMNDHGPREGVNEDKQLDVNMETLPDVLLKASIDREASSIDGDLNDFLESLSSFDYYDRLFLTAFRLNRGQAMADPTQRLASGLSQTFAATSS